MPDQKQDQSARLVRAYQSLEGLCCGDAFGERFFLRKEVAIALIEQRSVPAPPWVFTDDTMMAISIVATLEDWEGINPDCLAMSFAMHYDSCRGYGPAMHGLLTRIRARKGHWEEEAQALFGGEGSFGNGAAMRVAPVGAYFADDLELAVEHARRSALTTHRHPEAVAGAIAVAVASALAWQCAESRHLLTTREFLREICERTPASYVRNAILKASEMPKETPVRQATSVLGNGSAVTAQDTVPFAVWSAACHLHSYEDALWGTVAGLGDRDTTCAMVGGIVVMQTGIRDIPKEWLDCREPIPAHMLKSPGLLSLPA